jgi:methionyl-tRNA formyltransferase
LKIIFFGSSDISVPFLEELHRSRHKVILVVTSVDKPSGRGRKVIYNVVKRKAKELGIDFIQIEKFNDKFFNILKEKKFDAAVISSFGKILDKKLLGLANVRWINVHPSLLPEYRGPTPITSAILNGDKVGGVSIIEVVPDVDAGGIYAQIKFKIEEDDNRDSYEQKVIMFGKSVLLNILDFIEYNNLKPFPQDIKGITYTKKIKKEDLKINWEENIETIINKVKAFSSKPGAYCYWKNTRIKILKVSATDNFANDSFLSGMVFNKKIMNGKVIIADKKSGIVIKCKGNKFLKIELLQPEGKKVMSAVDFINGYRLEAGEIFE